jgi:signal transduction histidine kinase/PAS domain-containing protein
VTAANQQICAMWGHASEQVQHRPLLEAVPELQGQGFDELLRQVMATEVPVTGTETPAQLLREGKLTTTYYDFVYKPLYDAAGQVQGVMNVAVEVTAQVVARQQIARAHTEVQNLNEKLAAINEELYASNEEYLMANTALSETQQQLRQLNEELEARVQQRTQELEASHQAAKALQAELLAAAQRRAQQREDLYQIFAQAPAVVVLLRDPAHRMEYLNAAAQQLFPGRQLLGQPLAESQPESVAQGFVALLDQVYQTGETYLGNEVPLTVQPEPGQPARTRYFNFSYQAYREQDQIAGVSVFAHDVTEQVLARREREAQQHLRQLTEELEARVAERTRQIEQQSARTTRLIQEAPAAIAMLDGPQLVFEVLNADYQALFPDRVLQGKPILEALPELLDGPGGALLRQVYDTGVTFEGRELLMHFARPGDGQLEARYFDFIYQARYDAAGEIDGLLLFGFEVTPQVVARQQVQVLNQELAAINEELTATNEELHTSNSQLVRTNADLDNFVYTASHDLKSPISNIEGLLALLPELLPETVLTDEQVAPVLERMQESIGRFRRTITHLTDVSRLQAEFAQPAETVSLAAIIEDVRQDLHFQFLATGAVLDVAVNGAQPRVFSPKNLRSLMYNLLSNALKYCHPARTPRVRISCQPAGDSLMLTVQDNGLGLKQQRLFQLFQRLHTHVEGSGVGLYAVKKIVENAGGTITVASQPDVGTTFTLSFPA